MISGHAFISVYDNYNRDNNEEFGQTTEFVTQSLGGSSGGASRVFVSCGQKFLWTWSAADREQMLLLLVLIDVIIIINVNGYIVVWWKKKNSDNNCGST